ncbi:MULTISPECIES: GntR family transcriptional regulator [Microbacterium]|uniref:GntR family transcriptional regulator n=1 Tax=Microbacterium wangchenii TaxID=2541726 RepID=A0ABX5ST60_9MICO|nr:MULTISPECIES: GntR family transcriptional regulator [Microbacterium]MCK6067732.1 GntR family transcriptional regulator [Microbacterium sp. EYE_512]QBR89355.1 GntR family transcriptional regulator [Microbacterium wangchenii]TFV81580.1 GntR family transcriptional regulator [Microbacterium sp. dk485]TXK11028.1 GntR family transcriptional regulator [Microbacterium wangchenii]
MLIRIDPHAGTPLFAQIAASVRGEIAAGRGHAGERLPSAKEVAHSLGVNLHTVLHAYQDLRDEGLIELRRGRGAVITPAAVRLADLRADLADLVARAAAEGIGADTLAALVKELAPHPTVARARTETSEPNERNAS